MADRFVPQYVADEVLGEGSFGKVYRIHNQRAENFALKVWKAKNSEAALLEGELKVLARLSHPNLIRLFEYLPRADVVQNVEEKAAGYVMEFVPGETLAAWGTAHEVAKTLDLLVQALRGLTYLHLRHLTHGDLKPANFKVTKKGMLKILDFGLAGRLGESSQEVAGTLDYLAPEALAGERTIRSDLFSLGVVFYEALTGTKPYESALEMSRRFEIPPRPAQELQKKIPVYFSEILARMLEIDPQRRFSSALSVIRAINRHVEEPYELTEKLLPTASPEEIPFVGREDLVKSSETIFREWAKGAKTFPVLLISGSAGIGKTRLVNELGWLARLRGIEYRHHSLEEFLKGGNRSLPKEGRTLIAVEDLHRASPSARADFLKQFNELKVRQPHLGFALTWNPDFSSPELVQALKACAADAGAVEWALKNFSPAEIQAGAQEALEEVLLPKEWVEVLDILTQGNPALLLACCRFYRSRGGDLPHAAAREWEEFSLPEGMRCAVQARWQELSAESRRALTTALLLRDTFDLSTYAAILETDEPGLLAAFSPLISLGWVVSLESGYAFRGPLFRKFFLDIFGSDSVQKLQEKIFSVLRTRYEGAPLTLSELARAVGDREAFRSYALAAAERCLAQGDVERAIELYREVLEADPPPEQAAYAWAFLASAFSRLSRFAEGLDAYKKWYRLTSDDGTGIQTIKFHYLVGILLSNWGKRKQAEKHFQKALETGDDAQYAHHVPFHLKTLAALGRLQEQEGMADAARQSYERGLALARADSPEKAQLLRNLGVFWLNQADASKGRSYLEAALELSREVGYEEGLANTAFLLANLAKQEGQHDEALAIYGQVLEMAEKKQDPLKKGRTHSNIAALLIEMADYSHAEEHALKAQPLLMRSGTEFDVFLNRFHLATIGTYLGQFARAEDPELAAACRHLGGDEFSSYLERLKAESLRLRRDFPGALQGYARAAASFKKAKNEEEVAATLLLEVFCECLAGDLASARERLGLLFKSSPQRFHPLRDFQLLAATALDWKKSPGMGGLQEALQPVLRSAQQEWVILALRALTEILLRLEDQSGAEFLRQKAFEWLDGLYRSLPEEMQLSFERREDFERLAQVRRVQLKSSGISRERFLAFARINRRISETSDMQSIFEEIMDAAMALAGADRGFLLIAEPKKDSQVIPGFRVGSARNLKKENIGSEEFRISLSVIQEALRRRVTILTDDAQADPQFKHAESVHRYGLKSILVFPLFGEKEPLGVIYLDHRFEIGAFSDEILLFLKSFGDQSVLAVEKAGMLGELARANRMLTRRVQEQVYRIENLEAQLHEARQSLRFGYEEIIGQSPKMIQVLKLLDRITDTRIPVWIHGESGTGKELIARALHYNSDRKNKPFLAENCSAIPANLLESILFGHVRGAFTHADRDKVGLFEAAHGGTIFLDEIGDMSLPMQAKLLRVLQEGELRRVGSHEAVRVDIRVISATHQNLPEMIREGKFREDLFFRLNGMRIDLPPLRARREDIPLLAQYFLKKVAKENSLQPRALSKSAMKVLAAYPWPGNIRELENTIRNAAILAEGKTIDVESLAFKPELFGPPSSRGAELRRGEARSSGTRTGEGLEREREAILDALVRAHYHKGEAAKELKVTSRHLYNLLEKYRLPKNKWALKKLVEEERN
jgi:Nif-specific regulatory protein